MADEFSEPWAVKPERLVLPAISLLQRFRLLLGDLPTSHSLAAVPGANLLAAVSWPFMSSRPSSAATSHRGACPAIQSSVCPGVRGALNPGNPGLRRGRQVPA
jgi:hypothetical protein